MCLLGRPATYATRRLCRSYNVLLTPLQRQGAIDAIAILYMYKRHISAVSYTCQTIDMELFAYDGSLVGVYNC